MENQVIDEFGLRQYKDKAGVYFIKCYDGVIKIGCSHDVYTRLVSYQGVYWQNKILKIWQCNSPLFLEQQLHLVLAIELKQIRKGKYELFQLAETETQKLNDIIEKVDQRAIQIMQQMEEAVNQNFDEDVSAQIAQQLDQMEIQSNMEQSLTGTQSIQESGTSGVRIACKFNGCDRRTTKGYCFRHHPDNIAYNQQRYKEHSEKQKNRLIGYLTQIEELGHKIEQLETENESLKRQLKMYSDKMPADIDRVLKSKCEN